MQEVSTKAPGPRSIFAKEHAQRKTAGADENHRVANMTTDKHAQFQVPLSNAETEATTGSITDMDCIVNQLEREIYGITSNKQMQFKNKFSICLIKFEVW